MIKSWIRKDFPYRPGAKRTGDRFGLRHDALGSPAHLGDDRSGDPNHFVMPFDGEIYWSLEKDSAFGSILRIIPLDFGETEIQVAHTIRRDGFKAKINCRYNSGDLLPVITGEIGLTYGPHSHTEWIIKYSDDNYKYFLADGEFIADKEKVNDKYIKAHCEKYGMDTDKTTIYIKQQLYIWGIKTLYTNFAIRDCLPNYRTPQWGDGPVIIADPMKYLDI